MYMLFNMIIHDMCVDVINNKQDRDRVLLWTGSRLMFSGLLSNN